MRLGRGEEAEAWSLLVERLRRQDLKSFEIEAAGRLLSAWPESPDPAVPVRMSIALLGGYTTDPLANAVRSAACRENLLAWVYEAPFRAFREEILDDNSGLYRSGAEVVVLALHAPNYRPWPDAGASRAEVERRVEEHAAVFSGYWAKLRERLGCRIWHHSIEPQGRSYIGPAEREWPASPELFIDLLDRRLRDMAPSHVQWLDTAAAARQVGLDNWFDRRLYYCGKYGFNPRYIDLYGGLLAGLFRVARGTTRKVLVVDLDNTLWGGVAGDDGLEGIQLGDMSPEGEAYADFCEYLRQLSRRGVVLAVCSKNEPETAEEIFRRHPAMPLKLSDFAAFHCSWDDKVAGLRAIAAQLNVSPDHMVFADDNPAECELVRRNLASVEVVELKGDPAGFVKLIERGHWFDAVRLTEEDKARTASYQGRQAVERSLASAEDLPGYLRSLDMVGTCGPASATDLPRLAQMEAKTNQFNLTTRRYDEARLQAWLSDPAALVLTCRLRDCFADHGLVAYVVLAKEGNDFRIDAWAMSCRVFSRTLEHFMVLDIVRRLRAAGAARLIGEYRPTARNVVVRDLFAKLGFRPEGSSESGSGGRWVLDCTREPDVQTFVRSESSARGAAVP